MLGSIPLGGFEVIMEYDEIGRGTEITDNFPGALINLIKRVAVDFLDEQAVKDAARDGGPLALAVVILCSKAEGDERDVEAAQIRLDNDVDKVIQAVSNKIHGVISINCGAAICYGLDDGNKTTH